MMHRIIKLVILALLLSLPVSSALAQHDLPVIPALCYGQVTSEGNSVPAGITVEAIVDGVVCGDIVTNEAGFYGGPGIESKLAVSGNELDGKKVSFHITGSFNGKEYKQVKAGEVSYWGSGEVKKIDLQIKTSPATVDPSPPGGGGGPGGGGVPQDTDNDNNFATISETLFSYQINVDNGQITENVAISNETTVEIIQAKKEGKTAIVINVNYQVDSNIKILTVPTEVINSARDVNLQLNLNDITLEIPATIVNIFALNKQELQITLQAGNASVIRSEIKAFQETQGATILGTPTEIQTDLIGNTSVTLPLTGIKVPTESAAREAFLSSLGIFALHSDGDKELIKGELINDKDGVPIAIKFNTSKFSTFAIIKLSEQPKIA
ncbi:MAG TPA: hypothetical protein VFC73_08680, partial [Syntrophomonadaceae bacterium]|nr:hypothetical protein [Syntrophomonadaceae bacterium]